MPNTPNGEDQSFSFNPDMPSPLSEEHNEPPSPTGSNTTVDMYDMQEAQKKHSVYTTRSGRAYSMQLYPAPQLPPPPTTFASSATRVPYSLRSRSNTQPASSIERSQAEAAAQPDSPQSARSVPAAMENVDS